MPLLASARLEAQPRRGADAPREARAGAVDPATRKQAGEHFARGLELFNEGRFDAALAEFQRANELSPSPEALYNLGRVFSELGRAVEAAQAFERYLEENGSRLPRGRLSEVRERLARQKARIGRLRVEANVVGAVIAIDAVDQGITPLRAPIPVTAGLHTVRVRAPGHDEANVEVRIAGGQELRVPVELRRLRAREGTLRITSPIAQVRVVVDGQEVGRTPLGRTVVVPAGKHRVRGLRPGYDPVEFEAHVDEGAEALVELQPRWTRRPAPKDVGRISLKLPDAPGRIRVDGEVLDYQRGQPLTVPTGVHRLRIEVAERTPHDTTVNVPSDETLRLDIALQWEPDVLDRRLRDAKDARAGRTWMTIGGAVVLLGAAGLSVWNEWQIARTDAEILAINARCQVTCSTADMQRGYQLDAQRNTQDVLRVVGYSAGAVGFGVGLTGLILLLTTPSDDAIRASASAQVRLLPTLGGVLVHGQF